MMGMSAVSLIIVSTMAGPRANEEKFIDDFGMMATHTVADDGVLFDCVDLSGSKIALGPENTLSLSGTNRAPSGSRR